MTTALLTILFLLAYFAPTFCAHPSRRASVLFVNLFAFVLCVPWFIAMFMAIRSRERVV